MKLFYLFVFMLFSSNIIGQYTVTKVVGTVQIKNSGEILKFGSKLKDDDVLFFSSERDQVRVVVAGKGTYIISPSTKAKKEQNQLVEILKTALHLKSKEGYLSGRSQTFEKLPDAFETNEQVNSKHLISIENKYLFDASKYNIANGSRFFLQVEAPDVKPEIRPLKTINDTLIIFATDFGNNKNAKYKLGYFSKEDDSSKLLTNIDPHIDLNNEMEAIINLLILENKGLSKEKLFDSIYEEVYTVFGRPSELVFNETFNKLYIRH